MESPTLFRNLAFIEGLFRSTAALLSNRYHTLSRGMHQVSPHTAFKEGPHFLYGMQRSSEKMGNIDIGGL